LNAYVDNDEEDDVTDKQNVYWRLNERRENDQMTQFAADSEGWRVLNLIMNNSIILILKNRSING